MIALVALLGCMGSAPAPVEQGPRVITLGAGLTEIAMALAPEAVVAVDSSSLYPPAVEDLVKVGYNRAIHVEGVLSLGPTLVIASDDSGPPEALDQLRASGVRLEVLGTARSVDEVRSRIGEIGALLDRQAPAQAAVQAFDADCARLANAGWTDRPRALFLYATTAGSLNVSGTGTAGDAILQLAGIDNVVQGYEGYKPLTPEAAVQAAPDWLVLTHRGLQLAGGEDGLLTAPGLALTPAGAARQIVAQDDLMLLGFGPRTCAGALALGQAVRAP